MRRVREDHLCRRKSALKTAAQRVHSAKSSSGRLFRHDPVSL
ncbi:hypothetical protein HMPREF1546_00387 [Oscillibacter sp. KLE 1745]|nr:hypothetical protein HMPREF1546_00387 [Oscillibacter sp. KLE 1745]